QRPPQAILIWATRADKPKSPEGLSMTATAATEPAPANVRQTGCCVVGGGPGGLMLAYLLARRGLAVTLPEATPDSARGSRGDTVHPSALDLLDQAGLGERFLALPHGEMKVFHLQACGESYAMADLSRLRIRHPFVAMVPQDRFLDFLANEAR